MSSDRGKLGNFLKLVINWNWEEFCRAEGDPKYTGMEATVFSLIRTVSEGKLGAIKLAIDRVDGRVETPVRIEYPKVFYLYPHATSVEGIDAGSSLALPTPEEFDEPEPEVELKEDLLTFTLRQTLNKMAKQPRVLIGLILKKKREVEQAIREDQPITERNIPLVKSIVAANLLQLATEKNNFEAITEVFDQIDGKLVETYRMLGDDLYMVQYTNVAPMGAVKNKDGIYMIENKELAEQWKQKFSQK